jgi:hypothetical protein
MKATYLLIAENRSPAETTQVLNGAFGRGRAAARREVLHVKTTRVLNQEWQASSCDSQKRLLEAERLTSENVGKVDRTCRWSGLSS